jgi:hypothetical protein
MRHMPTTRPCSHCGELVYADSKTCGYCHHAVRRRTMSTGRWIAVGIFVAVVGAITASESSRPSLISGASGNETASRSEWVDAGGHLWTGVKLYYGPARVYVGDVLGGNENYVDPFTGDKMRGLKVRMANGGDEWKDRDAVNLGPWYVRRDDPALARKEWYEYKR